MESKDDLFTALQTQLDRAKQYIDRALVLENKGIDGGGKLTKRIRAELKFLTGLYEGQMQLKPCHLNSTNLSHLGAVIDVAEKLDVTSLLKPFNWYVNENKSMGPSSVVVDVVTSHGWFKVIARNPTALHAAWRGEGNFGEKSIDKQAQEYVNASQQNEVNFLIPKLTFIFTQGITEDLAECLLCCGVSLQGDILPNPGCVNLKNGDICVSNQLKETAVSECKKVNLDVTAMIALVSALTNGSCHFQFQDQILTEQAERERESPVLPQLNKLLEGKELFACSLAISSFQSILDTLGGPNEKKRARQLLAKVTEVRDDPSKRTQELSSSARIKPRPKIVFGTGDKLQAITITSNGSFIRAAKEQGVEFAVFLHEPRALTENKEALASPL